MWESLYLPLLFLCCNWKLIKNVCLLPIPCLGLPKPTVHTRGQTLSEVEFLHFWRLFQSFVAFLENFFNAIIMQNTFSKINGFKFCFEKNQSHCVTWRQKSHKLHLHTMARIFKICSENKNHLGPLNWQKSINLIQTCNTFTQSLVFTFKAKTELYWSMESYFTYLLSKEKGLIIFGRNLEILAILSQEYHFFSML